MRYPLKNALAVFNKFRRIREVLDIMARRSGGVRPALWKVLAILKRDGWRGLKRDVGKAFKAEQQPLLERREKALAMINRNGFGLEIGPSYNPIASKKEGFNVHILDHASAEELRAKYIGSGVNDANIEEVDFVWRGEPLSQLIGRKGYYDWIIASHVIEHRPDFISFLGDCERLLKDDGVLSLIIPDKRYCFDYLHGLTSTGELLDSYDQKRKRPSPGKVFDSFAGATKRNGQMTWDADTRGAIEYLYDFPEAVKYWQHARTSDEYLDVHNWRFTPASFRAIVCDIQALGLIHFDIKVEFDTVGCEFFVTLQKTQSCPTRKRLFPVDPY
jgi:predicted SAM-dependent methyltransferase